MDRRVAVDESPADPDADPAKHLITSASVPEVRYLDFVIEFAPWVGTWTRIQIQHTPTPDGFCAARVCARGGTGTPWMPWPCPTSRLADWAADAHDRALRARARTIPFPPSPDDVGLMARGEGDAGRSRK